MREQIIQRIAYAIIFLAIVCIAIASYWLFYPYKTYVVNSNPLPIISETVKSGQKVTLLFDRCNYTDKVAHIEKQLVGRDIQIDLPTLDRAIGTGCSTKKVDINLPKINNVGLYHIHYKMTWQLNPLRTESIEFDTDDFQIDK